ncbi:MAG: glycosyltransferase [Steroidobacteraceae bacterium]
MKPVLLFYCQHSLGIGHLMRSFAMARALGADYRVVFLNGGPLPPGIEPPVGIELINLPALGMGDAHTLVARNSVEDAATLLRHRRDFILACFARLRPAVLLVELFPFGRKKFAGEILPLLKRARANGASRPLVLSSVRDILVSERRDQRHHDNRAAWLCRRYFDAVLVHSDPRFAELEESFRPDLPLGVPLHYTGFVTERAVPPATQPRGSQVLVSAGGGIVGMPLFEAAIAALPYLPPRLVRSLRIVAGPFLPESDWQRLQQRASQQERIELLRSVPDLSLEMARCALSVSQCGYNSTLDILMSGTPALVVPYAAKGENEQSNRALRLANFGLVRMLPPEQLTAARLAEQMQVALGFRPQRMQLMVDGAQQTREIVNAELARHCAAGERVAAADSRTEDEARIWKVAHGA